MMIPFFVADRPMSLRLLKGLPLQEFPGVRIGIMAHANTSLNFQQALCQYPCDNFDYCDAIGGPCKYRDNINHCPFREYILGHTIKMCDSGIFTREGAKLSYKELFETYDRMGVEYGIMIDVFQNPRATLESAREALKMYAPYKDKFHLVGVAQGSTINEYINSYNDLKEVGLTHVAIGGLIRRLGKSVRYTQVDNESFMYSVLETLRNKHPNDWLFALGALHPSRLTQFKELNVWGDYKGWIFKYETRNKTLDAKLNVFASNHLEHLSARRATNYIFMLQSLIAQRKREATRQKKMDQQLFAGRRLLRALLTSIYQELQKKRPERARHFKKLTTHALMGATEQKQVESALLILGKHKSKEAKQLRENICFNHKLKRKIISAEERINRINKLLGEWIIKLKESSVSLPTNSRRMCSQIARLIKTTERNYRFMQVRQRVAKKILGPLL
jgi:hypothetical protein